MSHQGESRGYSRRELLRGVAVGAAALPLAQLGCSPGSSGDDDGDGSGGGDAGPTSPDAPVSGGGWASGGTAAMTDKASYPDPFTGALSSCLLVATTTEGPCNTATDLAREDVSEGWTGLPVRLALKLVDAACNPLAGATVKIWHTNLAGIYSGQTPSPGFCSGGDQSATTMDFFRGVQTTDAAGVVYFDTCYPGWYPGRAIHIHFQVKVGGASSKISQLFFPESLTSEIFAEHPEYKPFGQPDTVFASDGVFAAVPAADRPRLIVDYARMSDGAMLASKVVAVV